jgi:osmotically-inducible protein OsmY
MNAKKGLIAASAVCWALATGAVLANDAGNSKSDQPVADSLITTKVKAELVKDRDTKARQIDVDTKNGVVMLSGTVESMAEKQKAEQDARNVKGVMDVTNDLNVKR